MRLNKNRPVYAKLSQLGNLYIKIRIFAFLCEIEKQLESVSHPALSGLFGPDLVSKNSKTVKTATHGQDRSCADVSFLLSTAINPRMALAPFKKGVDSFFFSICSSTLKIFQYICRK